MGRKRTIDRKVTMAAIETVILRDGVGGLSIDAVAREAGISKSSVVYDFRNKSGLLAAFTRKRMGAYREQLQAKREMADGPDQFLHALIGATRKGLSAEETSAAMMITAATHTSEECHAVMRAEMQHFLQQSQSDAADPRIARLAFMALHGMKSLEFFNFHRFDDDTRNQLLDDIAALLNKAAPTPDPQPAQDLTQ